MIRPPLQSGKKNSQPRIAAEEGSLLLVALIVLGVIALSSIYLSLVLLNEIKATRFTDNAIVAYYVAESGSEDSLWRLKQARIATSGSPVATFEGLEGKAMCAAETGTEATSETGCLLQPPDEGSDPERYFDYALVTAEASDYVVYDMPQNSPFSTDIYNADLEGQSSASTEVSQLNINWYLNSCGSLQGSARLEITYTPISIATLSPSSPQTLVDVCNCDPEIPDMVENFFMCDVIDYSAQIPVDPSNFYRISFRSLDVPIKKLVMTTNAVAEDSKIPSQISVVTTGVFRESRADVTYRASWKDALSGIFSYVLFSEESLIKDTPGITSALFGSACGFCSDSVNGSKSCSQDSDCGSTGSCTVLNTATDRPTMGATPDVQDGESSAAFCFDSAGGELFSTGGIVQTDAGSCNARCNGYTYCGDGTVQSPNGVGQGGHNGTPENYPGTGYEECDAGAANSYTAPLTCRPNCIHPRCGDGVVDNGEYVDANGNIIVMDEECDEVSSSCTSECKIVCQDEDLDGYDTCDIGDPEDDGLPKDCKDNPVADPNASTINPGAPENCTDGIDNNCNGLIDLGDPACVFSCQDADGDGYGSPGHFTCSQGATLDCNDSDPSINPGAAEICGNGVDENCNGSLTDCALPWYQDPASPWQYRIKITVQGSQVSGTVNDFPVYVNLANLPASFFSNVLASGADIVVTAGDGTSKLDRDLGSFNKSGGTGELYFKAPQLTNGTNTDFYIYYGHATGAEGNSPSVWANGYAAVWHFKEDPSLSPYQAKDSVNTNHATKNSTSALTQVDGKLGKAWDFENGFSPAQYAVITDVPADPSLEFNPVNLTVSAWVNLESTGTWKGFYTSGASGTNWWVGTRSDNKLIITKPGVQDYVSAGTLAIGQWYHVAIVKSGDTGSNLSMYLNGVATSVTPSNAGSFPAMDGNRQIGTLSQGASNLMDGIIDELRISNVPRTSGWITTEYNNQNYSQAFYCPGANCNLLLVDSHP